MDISTTLISEEFIIPKLPAILIDSMIVDQDFNMVVVSQNVLDFLEFNIEELKGKNINYLSGTLDASAALKTSLKAGYFEEWQTNLFRKDNRSVSVRISGFYLGLIIDNNELILLKVKNLNELEFINQQLKQKKIELDNFIYRTSHDLRGPLATIKGLLNLVKMRKSNHELERLITLLDAHANKLDERLFQLVYWAQSDMESDTPEYMADFNSIETTLRRIIEQNAFVDFLELHFAGPHYRLKGLNEILFTSLLSNLLMYILSLPMSTLQNQIFFSIIHEGQYLKITIGVLGFTLNEMLQKAMRHHEFIYTDMINYPQLIHFYSAQKIA